MTMSTAVRFTAEQFDRILEGGVFNAEAEEKIELIFGEIREMVHPGPVHEDIVDLLDQWSQATVDPEQIRVRVEKTLGIPELDSVPRPDIAWVRQRSYKSGRPRVKDVLLIIEVSDSTLAFDTNEKLTLYAHAGVKEYWVVNVRMKSIEVFRRPSKTGYRSTQAYSVQDVVSPQLRRRKLPVKRLFELAGEANRPRPLVTALSHATWARARRACCASAS
jgi:Uma2 family endonuclease